MKHVSVMCVFYFIDQIQEIKNTRLAKLLCYNSDYVEKIQPNVFFHSANDYVPALKLV